MASLILVVMIMVSFIAVGALLVYLLPDHIQGLIFSSREHNRDRKQAPSRQRRHSVWMEGVSSITRPVQGRQRLPQAEETGRQAETRVRLSKRDLERQEKLRVAQGRAYARKGRRGAEGARGTSGDDVEESSKIADAKREYRKGNRFLDIGRGL